MLEIVWAFQCHQYLFCIFFTKKVLWPVSSLLERPSYSITSNYSHIDGLVKDCIHSSIVLSVCESVFRLKCRIMNKHNVYEVFGWNFVSLDTLRSDAECLRLANRTPTLRMRESTLLSTAFQYAVRSLALRNVTYFTYMHSVPYAVRKENRRPLFNCQLISVKNQISIDNIVKMFCYSIVLRLRRTKKNAALSVLYASPFFLSR